ncbi:MAG TPA: hypothetical protein VER11_25255 [Polyangiaceae bacterium]|nr:hypothetical protein [Polyangiaceae bacterium]
MVTCFRLGAANAPGAAWGQLKDLGDESQQALGANPRATKLTDAGDFDLFVFE